MTPASDDLLGAPAAFSGHVLIVLLFRDFTCGSHC